MDNENTKAVEGLNSIIRTLNQFDVETRERLLKTIISFFHIDLNLSTSSTERLENAISTNKSSRPQFSGDTKPTPKEFLLQKQPKTDVERMACIAYYLTHFRDTPYFKTLDLAKLNTEAAQPKFSNAAYAASNAANCGYLAPAPKGQRQISAAGEQFVIVLPDRVAAKQAMALSRRRKNSRRKK